jgi:hypothetical protein
MIEIHDPVFGHLVRGRNNWDGRITIPGLTENAPVEIELDDDLPRDSPPDDRQRAIFREFISRCDSALVSRIEQQLFEFVGIYRQFDLPSRPKASVERIRKPQDVWQEMANLSVFVPLQTEELGLLHLQWNAKWDEEHGMQVLYREGGDTKACNIGDDYFDD